MKGKFEHCHQFTDKGKKNYDQINWGSKTKQNKEEGKETKNETSIKPEKAGS